VKTNILGVMIDKGDMSETLNRAYSFLSDGDKHIIFTPNAEIVMRAYEDKEFASLLANADILTPDGIGVVYASKILKNPVSERVAGYDLVCNLLEKMAHDNKSVFFFGGKPGVCDLAAENVLKKYPGIKIAGVRHGYFSDSDNESIIKEINASSPDLLLVCLGVPKQENWICENYEKINASLFIGAGGSLDVFAGTVKRAPKIWQKLGLEWFYRIARQPSRYKRALKLPKFMLTVILNGRKFIK